MKEKKKKRTNTFVKFYSPAAADSTLHQEKRAVLRKHQQDLIFLLCSVRLLTRACYSDSSICLRTRPREQATPSPQCVFERWTWQHALQGKKEESVHTHQHISRAVNRMQEGEQERQQGSAFVDYPLTATVYILYCSISYTCHTCCLCEYQTLSTRCTHKQMVFCNRLYLKLFFPVAVS